MITDNTQVSGPAGTAAAPPPLQVKITTGGTYLGLDLPGVPEAVPAVRSLLRRYLAAQATPDLLLCASELASNAVVHSRSGRPGGRFVVSAQLEGRGVVLVSVLDEGARTPQDRPGCGLPEEHGRGLGIVEALAIESGSAPVFAGRLAWFRILADDGAASRCSRDALHDGARDARHDAAYDGARDGVLAGGRS